MLVLRDFYCPKCHLRITSWVRPGEEYRCPIHNDVVLQEHDPDYVNLQLRQTLAGIAIFLLYLVFFLGLAYGFGWVLVFVYRLIFGV
jgi:hypothetical protein